MFGNKNVKIKISFSGSELGDFQNSISELEKEIPKVEKILQGNDQVHYTENDQRITTTLDSFCRDLVTKIHAAKQAALVLKENKQYELSKEGEGVRALSSFLIASGNLALSDIQTAISKKPGKDELSVFVTKLRSTTAILMDIITECIREEQRFLAELMEAQRRIGEIRL